MLTEHSGRNKLFFQPLNASNTESVISYLIETIGFLYFLVLVWMFTDCLKNEPDRGIWIWVIVAVPGLGFLVYFFTRYLLRDNSGFLRSWIARFQTRELKRLKIQSRQIGNAYHWIHYGDKLREFRRFDQAEHAYRAALEKEPDNIQTLWGLAICLEKQEQFEEALDFILQTLEQNPVYKFGDVSLGRCLQPS